MKKSYHYVNSNPYNSNEQNQNDLNRLIYSRFNEEILEESEYNSFENEEEGQPKREICEDALNQVKKIQANEKDIDMTGEDIVHERNNSLNNAEDSFLKKKKKQNFVCNVTGCEKVYRSKENLNLHIKNIHEKIKPYKCKFCESTFSHRNGILQNIFKFFYLFSIGKTYHERKFHINFLPYNCTIPSKNVIYSIFRLRTELRFEICHESSY